MKMYVQQHRKTNIFFRRADSEFLIAVNRLMSRLSEASPKGCLDIEADETAIKGEESGQRKNELNL